jgi:hypothetical protein
MRIACFQFASVALILCLMTPLGLSADDKEEKERWEKLEKRLAELEPGLEKEEWAVKAKQLINELTKELQNAERIEVFRLNPKPLPDEGKNTKRGFHGYAILIEGQTETAERRKEIASFLGKTLHWNELRKALCFNPRHGVRVVSGKQTLDFLICFECYRVQVFEGDKLHSSFALSQPKDNPIEQLLRNVEKKATERP